MTPRGRPATMVDVAHLAGVSAMTVSRAFKGDSSVREPTRRKVFEAAESLGYIFDSGAASLRRQKSGFVAVAIPSLNNANFADTVDALAKGLKARDLQILLGYTNYDVHEEERLIEQLLRRRPEAIVVTGGRHTPRGRRLLETAGVPVIEMWDLPENPVDHVVGFSNAGVVQGMVDHLVAKGLRRIAFIGGDADRDTRGTDRRAGFVRAMQAHGLPTDRLIAAGVPPISMREGAQSMGSLIETMPDTEAVICVSDLSAFGALSECQRRGVDVPGRISIAGFGDFEISGVCVPSITTINPFSRRIGTMAAGLILDLLEGGPTEPRILPVEPELLLRESTA